MDTVENNMEFWYTHQPLEMYREVDWVPGYEDMYAVSNHGNVVNMWTEKEIKTPTCNYGYPRFNMCNNKRRKHVRVHRLVSHAFVRNPRLLNEVDHVDNVRNNNRCTNLRFCTREENLQNMSARVGRTSKYIGVDWCSRTKRWRAQGKGGYMARFEKEIDAARARDAWVRNTRGDIGKLNFPEENNIDPKANCYERKCSSKYVGVAIDRRRNKWIAHAKANKKHVYVGTYENEDDAGRARDNYVLTHPECSYRKLNFPLVQDRE